MEKRVVVTGLGSICGLGLSTNEIWQRSLNSDSGISEISYFDTSRIAVNFAGEVKDFEISPDILSQERSVAMIVLFNLQCTRRTRLYLMPH